VGEAEEQGLSAMRFIGKQTQIQGLAFTYLVIAFVVDKVPFFFSPSTGEIGMLGDATEDSIMKGNLIVQVAGVFFAGLVLARSGSRHLVHNIWQSRILVLYLLVLSVSLFASTFPWISLRRLVGLLVLLVIGFTLAQEKDRAEHTLEVLYRLGKVYFVIGLLGIVRHVLTGIGFFSVPFAIFDAAHRDAEILAVFLLLHWYFQPLHTTERSTTEALIWLLTPILILLTLSRTTIIGLSFSFMYIALASNPRIHDRIVRIVPALCLLVLFVNVLPQHIIEAVARLETAETMTGRTVLWEYLMAGQLDNLWVGAGIGAFWNPDNIYALQNIFGWGITGAHNGFFDVLLNTGVLGLGTLCILLIHLWLRSSRLDVRTRMLSRSLLIFIVIQNIAQGSFQNHRNLVEVSFWFLIAIIVVQTSKKTKSREQQTSERRSSTIPQFL
jgi:O-antigen ligase